MERLNLQEKRNTYASIAAGILVSIDNDVIRLFYSIKKSVLYPIYSVLSCHVI